MERVNPELVPRRILSNGMVIPGIGMGTFGNDKYTLNPWSLIIISCCNHFVYAVCRYV